MLRARSESFTESDASYASSSNESSEVSTSSDQTDSTATPCTEHTNSTAKSTLNKATITHVTVPRKIVIKYSSNIETPKTNPPLAFITQNSESSDAGISESEYVESTEDDDTTDEQTKTETTVGDVTEITEDGDETDEDIDSDEETEVESEDGIEEEEELEEEEDESEIDEEEEESSIAELKPKNGYTNGIKATKEYDLSDFELLKTIGKSFRALFWQCSAIRMNIFSTHILSWFDFDFIPFHFKRCVQIDFHLAYPKE